MILNVLHATTSLYHLFLIYAKINVNMTYIEVLVQDGVFCFHFHSVISFLWRVGFWWVFTRIPQTAFRCQSTFFCWFPPHFRFLFGVSTFVLIIRDIFWGYFPFLLYYFDRTPQLCSCITQHSQEKNFRVILCLITNRVVLAREAKLSSTALNEDKQTTTWQIKNKDNSLLVFFSCSHL